MNKTIVYKLSTSDFKVTDNLASFDIIASKADTMTSHGISFKAGAFKKAITTLQERRKMLPMFFNHNTNEIIGGFPVGDIVERGKTLKMKAQLNLDVEKAREVYSLIKQEVLTDLSVGISLDPEKMKYDENTDTMSVGEVAELYETSVVWSGSNPEAVITSFSAMQYSDLPIADEATDWNAGKAIVRVRAFTQDYKKAFLWYDANNADDLTAHKLPFVDVIDNQLMVVPKALSAIVDTLRSGTGDVKMSPAEHEKIKRNINRYYAKMDKAKVFETKYISEFTLKDCEIYLKNNGLSQVEAKTFFSIVKNKDGIRDVVVDKNEKLIDLQKAVDNFSIGMVNAIINNNTRDTNERIKYINRVRQ